MRAVLCAAIAICIQASLQAQEKAEPASPAGAAVSMVSVPFVGCPSLSQFESFDAPKDERKSVAISRKAGQTLVYYGCALDLGVLAPKGWHCLGVNGSGGSFLWVSSQPIDVRKHFAPDYGGFDGPVIELSDRHSDQNGDIFDKAQIVARAFPAYKDLVRRWMDGFDFPPSEYPFGPYPSDHMTYKSKTVVEYRAPARMEGLGTHSSLKRSGNPVEGVSILSGEPPDLILLSVRLPEELRGLTPVIIRQVEREFATRPR